MCDNSKNNKMGMFSLVTLEQITFHALLADNDSLGDDFFPLSYKSSAVDTFENVPCCIPGTLHKLVGKYKEV